MAIIPMKIGQLEYLVAEGIGVPHCFTTRLGGVSKGHLASMNIGVHRGDRPEAVEENLQILGRAVGFSVEDLVAPRQIHSDIVRRVGRADRKQYMVEGASAECDALITNEPGTALTVFTADCTPILLHDPVTGAVGAVHAGWRGTAMNIAGKAVKEMAAAFGCDPANIRAAIGPNIGFCCFQTDEDVPRAMGEAFGSAAEPFIRQQDEKYYVNLKAINELVLKQAGVQQVEISTDCTVCQSHRFWSHRVTRGMRGSQGAIIVCKEGSK